MNDRELRVEQVSLTLIFSHNLSLIFAIWSSIVKWV